ncbi:MAG: SufD family Fe-S cluster assembly protein, partial [archaeon]
YHLAPRTSSVIKAKSISKDGGINTFRGHVKVAPHAIDSRVSVKCDALQMDDASVSNTFPYMKIMNSEVDVAHEATVGKIDSNQLFYLMSRGLNEEQAMQLLVQGFVENVVKELPLE